MCVCCIILRHKGKACRDGANLGGKGNLCSLIVMVYSGNQGYDKIVKRVLELAGRSVVSEL